MNLPKDLVRINGYKGNKRSHVDVTVRTVKIGSDNVVLIRESEFEEIGFKNGLTGVTSYNYYNIFAHGRLTVKF